MINRIRRINLVSGACGGKSLTATNVRSQLGFKGYDIELVEEVIKDWTYIPRVPTSTDSFWLQASQMQKEDIRLRAGVDLIVSDSPVMLQWFYARYHKAPLQAAMYLAATEFEQLYPSIHIFIDREDKFYNEVGRYEKLQEAKQIDFAIKTLFRGSKVEFESFSCLDQDGIINHIISKITEPLFQK